MFLPVPMLLIVMVLFKVNDEIAGVLLRVIRIVILHVDVMRTVVIVVMVVVDEM